ncbi:MAG TPA: HAMP domain-containing protein, partial [Clostridiaceae bacterium]|nr:HAMP domain-containing protein [Clostridiaceae bacterium]
MAQRRKRTLSLRRSILLIFVFSLIVSVCCSGILVFRNWISSAKKTTEQIASDINANIYSQVRSYIQTPHHINEINHKVIKNGMLDLSDDKQRDRFFVEILRAYSDEIYSFSYGTVNGEYYGARRNEKGIIEIMRNNASTNGNSWYYTVNEDLTAGELALQAGKFDPRTRAWYKIAVETGGPAFSPLYKHFVIDGLAMSAAWPIYNDSGELEGVLGSHMLLFDIGNYLNSAVDRYNGIAFIIEKETGHLVANSMGFANFTVLEDGTLEANVIENIENPDFRAAYELYKSDPNHQQFFRGSNDNYFINSREINLNGVDWIVVSAVPESLLMSDIYTSMRWATFIAALSILLSILICNLFIEKFLRPMVNLLQVSDELASGNLSKRVDVVRNDEIGIISQRFNSVADRMQAHIENLESIVQERTKELQKANLSLEESREDLRLILDSSAEGIYGTDLEGNCTFCNRSCVRLLGYNDQNELLGKNMHELI